ncbi:MAG: hopanoid-associated phosphorylase [Rhodospirillaceae bacterium]
MVAEAECLAPLGNRVRVVCSGARADLARTRTESLVEAGVSALVSFGLAGALSLGLTPGDLILPKRVIAAGQGDRVVDPLWHARFAARLRDSGLVPRIDGALAGSNQAVTNATDKAALARASGAVAVDMESHIVAEVAARHGLPFLVVRAIADPAERAIPGPALAGLGPDGRTRPLAVAMRLLREPRSLPALLRLAADSRAALETLRDTVKRLGTMAFQAP